MAYLKQAVCAVFMGLVMATGEAGADEDTAALPRLEPREIMDMKKSLELSACATAAAADAFISSWAVDPALPDVVLSEKHETIKKTLGEALARCEKDVGYSFGELTTLSDRLVEKYGSMEEAQNRLRNSLPQLLP